MSAFPVQWCKSKAPSGSVWAAVRPLKPSPRDNTPLTRTYPNICCTYTLIHTHRQEGTRQQWMSHNREPEEEKTSAPCPAAGESLEVCVGVCVCSGRLSKSWAPTALRNDWKNRVTFLNPTTSQSALREPESGFHTRGVCLPESNNNKRERREKTRNAKWKTCRTLTEERAIVHSMKNICNVLK